MRSLKPIISIILIIALAFMPLSSLSVVAEDAESPSETLMFFSDYQNGSIYTPSSILTVITSIVSKAGKNVGHVIGCGDYTNIEGCSNYNAPEYDTFLSINKIKNITKNAFGSGIEYSFIQGNHDPFIEEYSGKHLMDKTGAYEYDSYILYLINTESYNPWCQAVTGSGEIVRETANQLNKYLNTKIKNADTRPIFIVTHVPLHFCGRTSSVYGTGDNAYSEYLFDVINKAAEKLNIVFLFGHNHGNGFDNYLGYGSIYKPVGSQILIPDSSKIQSRYDINTESFKTFTNSYNIRTLNFTYMNAGYVGYVGDAESEENGAVTSSVFEIYSDRLVITRFDMEGVHELSGEGHYNTLEYFPDTGVFDTEDTSILSQSIESPQTVLLKTEIIPDIPEYILGDINGDGEITAIDSNFMKKSVSGAYSLSETELLSADLNCDGQVTAIDANLIVKYINGSITEF